MTTTMVALGEGSAVLPDSLKLRAVRLDPPWNGLAVPVVTADEFRRYVAAWLHYAETEPFPLFTMFNSDCTVTEVDGALIFRPGYDSEDTAPDDPDYWSVVGVHDGRPVYALDGWQWETC